MKRLRKLKKSARNFEAKESRVCLDRLTYKKAMQERGFFYGQELKEEAVPMALGTRVIDDLALIDIRI